jgi:hypothetical protein
VLGDNADDEAGRAFLAWTAGHYDPGDQISRLYVPPGDDRFDGVLETLAHELTHHWLDTRMPPRAGVRRGHLGSGSPGYAFEEGFATFVEEHPEAADEEASGTKKRRKRAWRLRWPDAVRDEVLARLLERNRVQAAEELSARQRAEAEAKAAKKLGKAPVKGESKAAPVLALTPRETVGSALQSLLVERGIRVEDYSAQRQVPAGVIERMLASDLPFDPSDRSTTAFALAKGTSHDPALFNQELSVIERPRQRRTRGAPQAMAARKKRGPHEP